MCLSLFLFRFLLLRLDGVFRWGCHGKNDDAMGSVRTSTREIRAVISVAVEPPTITSIRNVLLAFYCQDNAICLLKQ